MVQRLRYKDYQLVAKPAMAAVAVEAPAKGPDRTGLFEVDSVKEFSSKMEERGVLSWWRQAMGYA